MFARYFSDGRLNLADAALLDDKNLAMFAMKSGGDFSILSDRLRDDEDVTKAALIAGRYGLYFTSWRMRSDFDVIKVACMVSSSYIRFAADSLLQNTEQVLRLFDDSSAKASFYSNLPAGVQQEVRVKAAAIAHGNAGKMASESSVELCWTEETLPYQPVQQTSTVRRIINFWYSRK